MKKVLSLILALILCLSLCACGDKTPQSIELTTENINQYITILAAYNNYREECFYLTDIVRVYHSYCDVDLQAYTVTPGNFSNVEITIQVYVPNDVGDPGEYPWCPLGGEPYDPVQFTFRISSAGTYSHSHAIECSGPSTDLRGNCNFTIISVSGTFIPAT